RSTSCSSRGTPSTSRPTSSSSRSTTAPRSSTPPCRPPAVPTARPHPRPPAPLLCPPVLLHRQIAVDPPDMIGRPRILEVHAQGKPMAQDVDLLAVARRTPGVTGADLAHVLNEAALLTARSDKKIIDNYSLDEAIDRVIAGPQKRTRI